MINKVIIVGNLGQDPELRYTAAGDPVANMSVATTFKTKENEYTEWHRVTVWGQAAEACGKYLTKGRQVYVEGRLQTRKYEDKEGVTRYTTEIVANEVKFLGGNPDKSEAKEETNSKPAPAAKTKAKGKGARGQSKQEQLPDDSGDDMPF